MSIVARARSWLQKPWFVGVLVIIAVLYVGKNIVLPIIDMTSSKPRSRVTKQPEVVSQAVAPQASSNATKRSPVSGADTVTATVVDPEVARQKRQTSLAEGVPSQRNPFTNVRLEKKAEAKPEQKPAPIVPLVISKIVGFDANEEVAKVLKLKAVMAGKRSKLALINRDIVAVDETVVLTEAMAASVDQSVFGNRPSLVGEYRVMTIGQNSVSLVGPPGRVQLYLESPY